MTAAPLLALALFAAAPPAPANGPFDTFADAAAWVRSTTGGVTGARVAPQWIGDGPAFWFRRGAGDGAGFLLADPHAASGGVLRPLFDRDAVAAALADRGVGSGGALAFRSVSLPAGADGPVRFSAGGRRWEWAGGALTDRGGAGDGAESASVERLRTLRPSARRGGDTQITFVNATAGSVRVRWVNGPGRGTSYGTVPAGGRRAQHTFAGHVWLVEDADGNPLAAFAATGEEGVAVVDGAGPVPELERPRPTRPRPGSPRAEVRSGDLFLTGPGGDDRRLTDAAAEPVPDGFDRIEYRRPRLSPDGETVAAVRAAVATVTDLVLIDPGDPVRRGRRRSACRTPNPATPSTPSPPSSSTWRPGSGPTYRTTDSPGRIPSPGSRGPTIRGNCGSSTTPAGTASPRCWPRTVGPATCEW